MYQASEILGQTKVSLLMTESVKVAHSLWTKQNNKM